MHLTETAAHLDFHMSIMVFSAFFLDSMKETYNLMSRSYLKSQKIFNLYRVNVNFGQT